MSPHATKVIAGAKTASIDTETSELTPKKPREVFNSAAVVALKDV